MTGKYKPVSFIIFEADGVIFNTQPIVEQILNQLCEKYQKKPVSLDLQHNMLGHNEWDALNMFIRESKLPIRFNEVKGIVNELENKLFLKVKMQLGIQRLICHFHRHKVPIAIASSSTIEALNAKFAEYKGIKENFSHIVAGSSDEEVTKGKPDPTIFNVCASRFDPPADPECCLVFESSPAGVAAACCANMQVVMCPDPKMDKELTKEATLVINSMADFRPEMFGLPPIPR